MDPARLARLLRPAAPEPAFDPLIAFVKAAEALDITPRTLERWQDRPELEPPQVVYVGRRRFIRLSELIRFIERRVAASPPPKHIEAPEPKQAA